MAAIGVFTNFKKREDIRVECSLHRIWVQMTLTGDPFSPSYGPTIRMNHWSTTGPEVVCQEMPLMDLLELDAQGEGAFSLNVILPDYSAAPDYSEAGVPQYPAGTKFLVEGSFAINPDAALLLQDGNYLSIALNANVTVESLELRTIDHLVTESAFRRINPVPVMGITKQINTSSSYGILFPPSKVTEIQVQGETRKIEFEAAVLPTIARQLNDIVCVDTRVGTISTGFKSKMFLGLNKVKNLTIVPSVTDQWFVYLVERVVVA